MNRLQLIDRLSALDQRGVYALAKGDLEKLFPDEGEKAMEKSLQRMVGDGLLLRPARGVYLNPGARSRCGRDIEEIARVLRRGEFSYISLESMLAEYGRISQIPVSHLTVMTTGAGGIYETPFGTIEFTHTKRSRAALAQRTLYVEGRPLRVATEAAAIQDLVRVGRNTNMIVPPIDAEEHEQDDGGDGGHDGGDGKAVRA